MFLVWVNSSFKSPIMVVKWFIHAVRRSLVSRQRFLDCTHYFISLHLHVYWEEGGRTSFINSSAGVFLSGRCPR